MRAFREEARGVLVEIESCGAAVAEGDVREGVDIVGVLGHRDEVMKNLCWRG